MYPNLNEYITKRNLEDISYRRSMVQEIDYTRLAPSEPTFSTVLQQALKLNHEDIASEQSLFQWCATLEFIANQIDLRQSILDTIDAQAKAFGPAQATLMMYQDHRKMILALERYRSHLESRTPAKAESSVRHTYARRSAISLLPGELEAEREGHIAWWSAHYALALSAKVFQADKTSLEPVWGDHLHNIGIISGYHQEVCAAHLESLGVSSSDWQTHPAFIATLNAVFDLRLSAEIFSQCNEMTLQWDSAGVLHGADSQADEQLSEPIPLRKAYLRGEDYVHPPSPELTLAGALEETIARDPNAGIVYLRDQGEEHFETYSELRARALKICGQLQGLGIAAGTPVMVMVNRPEHFVSTFWASVLGGYLPIPMAGIMSLGRGSQGLAKLQSVLSKIDAPVVVTDDELVDKFQGFIPPGFILHLLGAPKR